MSDEYKCPTVHVFYVPSGWWFSSMEANIDELLTDPRLWLARVGPLGKQEWEEEE